MENNTVLTLEDLGYTKDAEGTTDWGLYHISFKKDGVFISFTVYNNHGALETSVHKGQYDSLEFTFEEILACAERIEELLEEMEGEMPDEE